jgi:pyridoxal 5'-phosphate synthase pdxT subunit
MILNIGVLSLQGDFQEHIVCLRKIEKTLSDKNSYRLNIIEVRDMKTLDKVDALIIPGGESTVISKLLNSTSLFQEVQRFVQNPSKVVWGTCAGIILLANAHEVPFNGKIGGLDIRVGRNAYGRQVDSFKSVVQINEKEGKEREELIDECVFFIRAPKIVEVNENPNLKVLAYRKIQEKNQNEIEETGEKKEEDIFLRTCKGEIEPTAVLQDNRILGSTFHPEISVEEREEENWISQWHKYFINLVYKNKLKFSQKAV